MDSIDLDRVRVGLNVKIRNYHTPKANFTTHIVHKMEHLWFDPDATPDTPRP